MRVCANTLCFMSTVLCPAAQVWGWRIPFALSFFTALMGAYLRQGMPEPHAFLEAR